MAAHNDGMGKGRMRGSGDERMGARDESGRGKGFEWNQNACVSHSSPVLTFRTARSGADTYDSGAITSSGVVALWTPELLLVPASS